MNSGSIFMQRCLQLASLGAGRVSPNPMVGAVLVHNGEIIGEGWHREFGQPHAEAVAIEDCRSKGYEELLPHSVLYVNLEPCSHFGKTPPCADLILENKIPEIHIGMRDPSQNVNGMGIKKLKKAGLRVIENVMKTECMQLNSRFLSWQVKKRPYIILKYAQTKDGFIAPEITDDKIHWISNRYSRMLSHKWRSEEDSIMVGFNTVIKDDPRLTVRNWSGKNPVRIVVDFNLSLPSTFNLFGAEASTLVFNTLKEEKINQIEYIRYDQEESLPEQFCKALHERNIQSVIIEGGLRLIQEFVNEDLWDEARIFTASSNLIKGLTAPFVYGHLVSKDFIDDDELCILKNNSSHGSELA